jgi:hypothetical protein
MISEPRCKLLGFLLRKRARLCSCDLHKPKLE